MDTDYIKIYNLENYILTDVRDNFLKNGYIEAFDFFCIVIWKANRAKSKIAEKFLKNDQTLEENVRDLTQRISSANNNKEKFKVLIDYSFRLPMASAILSVLYPDQFTVYDVRVCEILNQFSNLGDTTNFEKLWNGYQEYIEAVKNYEPQNLPLREKDRFLWGKSFSDQLKRDIKSNFKKQEK